MGHQGRTPLRHKITDHPHPGATSEQQLARLDREAIQNTIRSEIKDDNVESGGGAGTPPQNNHTKQLLDNH